MSHARALVAALLIATLVLASEPAPASAFNPIKPICGVAGFFSGLAGKACNLAQHGDRLLKAGGKLLTGHVGGAAKALAGAAPSPTSLALGLTAVVAWVVVGARASLHETAKAIAQTTRPNLGSTWFSATYWRMAGLATLLTLPFLFAAAVQALLRSDLALLARAAFGYLPLAMLSISITAPLTMLLLAASDEMSSIVSAAAGNGGVRFLQTAGGLTIGLSAISGSPFLAFFVGLLTTAGAVVLWLELLIRQAAVYVVVLMLPLAFAALVWPARRVWAIRSSELLVALILSKFAIVAVLGLAGAALGRIGADGAAGMLTGMVLVSLGAFTPWALLRLLPLAELASGAAGALRGEAGRVRASAEAADVGGGQASGWAEALAARMRTQAEEMGPPLADGSATDDPAGDLAKLMAAEQAGVNGRDEQRSADSDVAVADNGTPGSGPGAGRLTAAVVRGADAGSPGAGSPAAGSPGAGSPGAGSAAASGLETEPPARTAPGRPDIWQAPDNSWRVLDLGGENEDYRPVWPPGDDGSGADDRDPLPPPQDPEDGRL